MLRHVDLCSGIGGFALGFQWAELSRPVLFCDIEPWSRKVLRKHWPDVPIAEDVKELANDPDGLIPDCDILTAGYPCQPFSIAGDRRGAEDDRHIWPEIFTIIKEKRPTFCVFENVYGHISMGLDEVLSDLEGAEYSTRAFVVPAVACDAPHRRDRVWIIARNVENARYRTGRHKWVAETGQDPSREWAAHTNQASGSGKQSETMANTSGQRLQGSKRLRKNEEEVGERRESAYGSASQRGNDGGGQANLWLPEPPVGRVAYGIPRRVDRLRGLGNAIVPQIAQRIGETIKNSI